MVSQSLRIQDARILPRLRLWITREVHREHSNEAPANIANTLDAADLPYVAQRSEIPTTDAGQRSVLPLPR